MKLDNEIINHLIQDFKKKDLSMSIKWQIIRESMQLNNYSFNSAVKQLGISKTTLHTWRRAYELGDENHKKLLDQGWSETDIQNSLKHNSAMRLVKKIPKKRIDVIIEETISSLGRFVHDKDYSIETPQKIRELQNVLNRILMRVEK